MPETQNLPGTLAHMFEMAGCRPMLEADFHHDHEYAESERQWYEEELLRELEWSAAQVASAYWKSAWPGHCRSCGGWGGSVFYESHGLPGPAEQLFDGCDALGENFCHRCGRESMDVLETDVGPAFVCVGCGWSCDDGDPGRGLL